MKINESTVNFSTEKKALVLTFTGDYNRNKSYDAFFNEEETAQLLHTVEEHLTSIGDIGKVKPEHQAYIEEIHTCSQGVERTMNMSFDSGGSRLRLHLECYTTDVDDNWIRLTPTKAAGFASLIHGYLGEMI